MKNEWIMPAAYKENIDLKPVDDYARRVFPEAFSNIGDLSGLIGESPVNVTVFYSKRKQLSPEAKSYLYTINDASYEEAKMADGFLYYFQGDLLPNEPSDSLDSNLELDFTPDCMSFCIWQSPESARLGAQTPSHKEAVRNAPNWYENSAIQKYSAVRQGEDLIFTRR